MGDKENQQIVRHEGDQRDRRTGADARHAPADAEQRRAENQRHIDVLEIGQMEMAV